MKIVDATKVADVEAEMSAASRQSILREATLCVCGDREEDYGTPEQNFQTIADLWNAYLSIDPKITPKDVAVMMILLKIARITSGHAKSDNWIDIAGYAACGGEVEANNEQNGSH